MSVFATILMLVIFPLNSLLLFTKSIEGPGDAQADFLAIEKNGQPSVNGVETVKKSELKLKAQAVDEPKYQPVRKDKARNLAIPNAHAWVVVDADTGAVLGENHSTDQRQIASLTKVMTAVLVMERIKNLDEIVTIDEEPVYTEGTKIGCPRSGYCISPRLKVGERISVRNLLQAMLMNSANDAAIALGKYMAGSQDAFAEVMNQKAQQLGLTNTHFCTPSGLEPDGRESECYSSAYDIARIAAYSMRYDGIWKIFRQPNNTNIFSEDGKIMHTILNTDLVLDEIPNVLGGKTGFTPLAGYSLLMGVSDPSTKHRIIAVLLDDTTRWQDIRSAISWSFNSYTWQ